VPTAITAARATVVREPGDPTLARPTFRTGLVEQVTPDGPTTNGSGPPAQASAPAPRPDRPRRTRPLRAT
jgi:hypothetical protein